MITIVFALVLFAAVAVGAYAWWGVYARESSPVAQRLRRIRRAHGTDDTGRESAAPAAPLALLARLGGFMPSSDNRDSLRAGLVRAGFRRPEAPLVLLGAKIVLAVLFPVAWLTFAWATARPANNLAGSTILLAFAGFFLPSLWLSMRLRSRHDEIVCSLPDALDLMVVCVEAGLGIGAAMQRVAGEVRLTSHALSQELLLVHREMQAGISRTDALRGLARRTGVEDVYALVAMLVQTDKLGTSVAQALRAHADTMRTRRRQRAEQMARKANVMLAFPLVFLIFPALLVVILGPAAIQLAKALVSQ